MFNLEGLIPKLCELAQEMGNDERAHNLRSAGLQALSSMVYNIFSYIVLLLSHLCAHCFLTHILNIISSTITLYFVVKSYIPMEKLNNCPHSFS